MRSPFTPAGLGGPGRQLPLDATVFWVRYRLWSRRWPESGADRGGRSGA
jgi:hypothetical protein